MMSCEDFNCDVVKCSTVVKDILSLRQDTNIMSTTDSGETSTVLEELISSHSVETAPEQDLLHVPATSRTIRTVEMSVVDTSIPPPVRARSAVQKRAGRTEQKKIYKPPDRRTTVIRTASRVLDRRQSNLLQYRLYPEIGRKFVHSALPSTNVVNDTYPTVSVHLPEINKPRITPHLVQPTAQMPFMEPARRPHSVSRMQYVADNVRTSHSIPSHSPCYDDTSTTLSVFSGEAISRIRKSPYIRLTRIMIFALFYKQDVPEPLSELGSRSLHRRFTDPILTLPCFRPTVDICPHHNEYELLTSPTQRSHSSLLTTTYQAEYNDAQWEQSQRGELVSPIQFRTTNTMCAQTEQLLHHNLETVQLSRWRSQLNPPPRYQIARAVCVPYVRQFRIPPPPIFLHTITSMEDPVQLANPITGTRHDGYTNFYVPFGSIPVKENQERLRASKNYMTTVTQAIMRNHPSKSVKKNAETEKVGKCFSLISSNE
ncbi:uncharacterized protein DEA37_0007628 [Paragonimus westermani]|uniref:Uncharacterized protein n=1 Tax=Paragonimus westermani TaxID=34504 RepID=A0A5J4NSH4_9TREM|nr:uncharacterized protein DEA37_0007628 [Paragonimus westermani]